MNGNYLVLCGVSCASVGALLLGVLAGAHGFQWTGLAVVLLIFFGGLMLGIGAAPRWRE